MVIVQFEDAEAEKQALGWLAGRFSFKSWSNGDLMLHERVLPYLARQGIPFKGKPRGHISEFDIWLLLRRRDLICQIHRSDPGSAR